jgi:uncharacterized membrane protein YfcA
MRQGALVPVDMVGNLLLGILAAAADDGGGGGGGVLSLAVLSFVGGAITSGLTLAAAIFARGNSVGRWQGTVDTRLGHLEREHSRLRTDLEQLERDVRPKPQPRA